MNRKTCCVLVAVAVSGFAGAATDYASLVQEIADAPSGGTVTMAAGSYDATETIVIDKPLTLVGADRATTIVDGKGAVRCFEIKSNDVKLHNLTIQNGAVTGGGAGIYSSYGNGYTGVLVSNCLIRACTTTDGKGGGVSIYSYDSYGAWKLIDVDFADCLAQASSSEEVDGGALYAVNAELIGCTFTNNSVHAKKPRAGAAYLYHHVSLTDCEFVNNRLVPTDATGEMTGGALDLRNTTCAGGITNCLFAGNFSGEKGSAGAVFLWSATTADYFDFVGCAFVSNSCGRCHSAVYVTRTLTRVSRCLFEGNYDTEGVAGERYGALVVRNGTPVTECAFIGNRNIQSTSNQLNSRGVALSAFDGTGPTPVKKCVFIDNRGNYLGPALMNRLANGGFVVEDCWFERNRSALGPICFVEYSNCTPFYRNCMFLRNEGTAQIGFGHFENCSFFCNDTTNGTAAVYLDKGESALTNCVVYGTTYKGASGTYDFKTNGSGRYQVGDVSHSYFSKLGTFDGIAEGDQYGNRVGAEIKFVDAANGDFRVTRTDKVLHNGGVDLAWMKAKGACDLGTGPVLTYDNPVRRTGLHITYANAVRRRRGNAADIGCLEYNDKQGLVMVFK